ncbi:hypothetical protein [Sinanaerobacter chloroacetimidivorans]|uniref:TFIIS-type domain-containing protein n=1 Tax=Sinanaerobacter chloroacetimidivorans TaxID=2818044 RepID=A0A8J7W0G6_9FIRM|nr:hypothetical protein [Sinanaerobacter chloroacetimidivorans]MBR0598099.1 hypothetical protein [Sinanaerobacter chloroacetimidivorans]
METFIFLLLIGLLIYAKVQGGKDKEVKQQELKRKNLEIINSQDNTQQDVIRCPKCLSSQTSANKRGITLTTGLIGSQTVYITCLQCGHRWKAGS